MRHLTYDSLKKILVAFPRYKDIKFMIETGTFLGETSIGMAPHFKKIFTIEINQKSHEKAKLNAVKKGISNIEFYLGDSVEVIKDLIGRRLPKDRPCLFFLDAHVTENGTDLTGKGIVDVPLLEELDYINKHRNENDIIIIDDIRIFGKERSLETANADWSNITLDNVMKYIDKDRIFAWFYDPEYNELTQTNDRYYILMMKKQKILKQITSEQTPQQQTPQQQTPQQQTPQQQTPQQQIYQNKPVLSTIHHTS